VRSQEGACLAPCRPTKDIRHGDRGLREGRAVSFTWPLLKKILDPPLPCNHLYKNNPYLICSERTDFALKWKARHDKIARRN